MPDVPSVTREYLEQRHLLVEDVNQSVVNSLFDYMNNFSGISYISQ